MPPLETAFHLQSSVQSEVVVKLNLQARLSKPFGRLGSVLALALAIPAVVTTTPSSAAYAKALSSAQGATSTMTASDVQRLEGAVADATRDVSSAPRDIVSQLETALQDAREEVIYLKVKMRKGESVSRSEYFELRDRIDDIRSRASSAPTTRSVPPLPPPPVPASPPRTTVNRGEVPVGTEFDIRLGSTLNSSTAQVEQRFEATTMVDLIEGDRVLVPAGSTMRGIVSSVTKAGRLERRGSMTLAFDQITVRGRDRQIKATVTQALESEGVRGEAAKIGTGAGVGAIIGGILGGFKGAVAGILIGGGGTIAATEGKDVELPAGTVLRVRLDSPLDLR